MSKCEHCGQELPPSHGLDYALPEFIDDLKSEHEEHGNDVVVAIMDVDGNWCSPVEWDVIDINGKKVLTITT